VEPAAAKEHPPFFHHHLDGGVGAWGLLDDTTIEGGGNNSRADFSGEHGSTSLPICIHCIPILPQKPSSIL
jgi:hypothetical protein